MLVHLHLPLQIIGLSSCILSKLNSLGRQVDVLHFLILLASHVLPQTGAGIKFIACRAVILGLLTSWM